MSSRALSRRDRRLRNALVAQTLLSVRPRQECLGYRARVVILVVWALLPVQALRAGEKRVNALRNGSFEAGWCNEIGRRTCNMDAAFPDASWLTQGAAFHGKTCLKIDPAGRKDPFARAKTDTLFTIPFPLTQRGLYTISLWAKAIQGKARISITAMYPYTRSGPRNAVRADPIKGASASATVTDKSWSQVKVTVPGSKKPAHLVIAGANLYVDAIEALPQELHAAPGREPEPGGDDLDLEDRKGRRQVSFVPAAPIEAGIHDPAIGHVHYQEEQPLHFPVTLYNYTAKSRAAVVVYELMNHEKAVVAQSALPATTVPAQNAATVTLALPKVANGVYSLKYWVKGGERAWGEIVLVVMNQPDPKWPAPTGLLCDLSPPLIRLMQRAGMLHYATLCDHAFRMRDDYNFETRSFPDRTAIARMATDAGLTMCMSVNPWWWGKKADPPWHPPLPARHPDPGPDPETYFDALNKFAKMYAPFFKVWWIQDELEGHAHPHEFLPIYKQTIATIRKYRPDAEFMISAAGSWLDGFERVGGIQYVDWFGGSVGGHGGEKGRKLGWLVHKHKKKLWTTAGAFTAHRPFSRLRGGHVHANYRAHGCLINSVFLHHASVVMDYRTLSTCYDWGVVHDPMNLQEADNSMTCALALFAIAGQVLTGVDPDPEPLDTQAVHGGWVWAFTDQRRNRPGVCFFPGRQRSIDMDLDPNTLALLDHLGNPLPVKSDDKGRARIDVVAGRHCFLYGNGVPADVFREAIQNATTSVTPAGLAPTQVYARYTADPGKGLAIQVTYVNRQDKPWPGPGRRPPFSRNPLAPNAIRVGRQPYPYKDLQRFPAPPVRTPCGWVWLHTARKQDKPVTLDGHFAEWQPERSSAIFYNQFSLSAMDRGSLQAEHHAFKITCDYGMDYRVEWWAGYDADNLYVCARVFDDDLVAVDRPKAGPAPDRLELRFYSSLDVDLLKQTPQFFSIWLEPKQGGKALRVCRSASGQEAKPLAAKGAIRVWDDPAMRKGWAPWTHPGPHLGYCLEVALPWQALGVKPKAGSLLGFDLLAHETDMEDGKPVASVLRWAGGSRPCGQLRLATRGN